MYNNETTGKITPQFVGMEALITLNSLVSEYLDEFNMRPKPKEPGIFLTDIEFAANALIRASHSDETDYYSVMSAVNKTAGAMRDIEQNLISHDLSKYIGRRKTVEQLGSIMHISRAYPADALKRLKRLRPQVEMMTV